LTDSRHAGPFFIVLICFEKYIWARGE